MGEMKDKGKGAANKAGGSVKSGVGKATGDKQMENEGKAQKAKGKAQDVKGSIKGAAGDH